MTSPVPVVAPADVARRAGVDIDAPGVEAHIIDAITDVVADVEGYLGRPVQPTEVVDTGLQKNDDGTWPTSVTPVISIISEVAELDDDGFETGLFTVTYTAGLDLTHPSTRPILRYILAAAAYGHPSVRRLTQAAETRRVKSVSADGQAVTYEETRKSERPEIPKLNTIDRWRVRGREAYLRDADKTRYSRWPHSDNIP